MRIAWFTPFSRRSAIGEFSKHVTDELGRSCHVDVWVSDHGQRHDTELRVVDPAVEPNRLSELDAYDAVVFNFGNHIGFHRTIYEVSRRRRGIAVLHDRVYQHMLGSYWLGQGPGPSHYVERMESFYGFAGQQAAEGAMAGQRPHLWEVDEDAVRFPLFEENLVGAEGVVVHAADHASVVAQRWLGPICALFLPTYPTDWTMPIERDDRPNTEKLVLLTVGDVNRNKHVHAVIDVLGNNEDLAQIYEYRVVGRLDDQHPYTRELRALIRHYGLGDQVTLHGYEPDDVLARHIRAADVFVNLRHPSWESGSASLARQLASGKPVVVYEGGGFRGLPEGSVVKLAPGDATGLTEALRRLGTNPGTRVALGDAAQRLARERSVGRYASEFLEFLDDVRSWRPILGLCDRVAAGVAPLGDANAPDIIDRAAEEVAMLFTGDRGP